MRGTDIPRAIVFVCLCVVFNDFPDRFYNIITRYTSHRAPGDSAFVMMLQPFNQVIELEKNYEGYKSGKNSLNHSTQPNQPMCLENAFYMANLDDYDYYNMIRKVTLEYF